VLTGICSVQQLAVSTKWESLIKVAVPLLCLAPIKLWQYRKIRKRQDNKIMAIGNKAAVRHNGYGVYRVAKRRRTPRRG